MLTSQSRTEPVRTCVGCRRVTISSQLVRFVSIEGHVMEGDGRPGRGAWLCRDRLIECFDRALDRHAWGKSFRARIESESLTTLKHRLLESMRGDAGFG